MKNKAIRKIMKLPMFDYYFMRFILSKEIDYNEDNFIQWFNEFVIDKNNRVKFTIPEAKAFNKFNKIAKLTNIVLPEYYIY